MQASATVERTAARTPENAHDRSVMEARETRLQKQGGTGSDTILTGENSVRGVRRPVTPPVARPTPFQNVRGGPRSSGRRWEDGVSWVTGRDGLDRLARSVHGNVDDVLSGYLEPTGLRPRVKPEVS